MAAERNPITMKIAGVHTGPDLGSLCLRPEVVELLSETKEPRAFLEATLAQQRYQDAFDFVTHWFPKRQLIWWGCLCCWQGLRPRPSDQDALALRAALQWVIHPGEETRRHAERAGYAADIVTPAGNLALAAYLTGGSMTPPGAPDVPPDPQLAGDTVANVVTLLLAKIPAAEQPAVQAQFVRIALDIVSGKLVWTRPRTDEPAPAPPMPEQEGKETDRSPQPSQEWTGTWTR
ncbi:MAG: hypothetical protein AB7K24_28115 [Gemmataceae bacterium]